jgi:uncharacterized protein YndB with AHSA1/START domain
MSPIVSSIEIARPADEVYAYATDPSRFAEWQRDVVSVRIEGSPLRVGTTFITTRRVGGSKQTMTQEVTEVIPSHHWASRGVDGPIRPHASVTVEPLGDGSRCRVTFALDFEGHGLGVPLVPMVRRLAANGAPVSHRRLKELLEAVGHRQDRDNFGESAASNPG